jgi:ribose 5-phosphate isomerase B
MNIAVGSDHRGFEAKGKIRSILESRGITVHDFGTDGPESSDYPDAAIPTAQAVATGECERGILCCGTGIGMSITANKVLGIRASLCHDAVTAEMSRRHNDANVLCIPADLISEDVIHRIVGAWLDTPFDGGRHQRRNDKISEYESHNGQMK